ncbi:hypothetical protein [Neolewinella antarctica]|uniref:Uncharacterized protein n=1 Tax=Neolewinella antarctica TaxID=442734 RepID=A0ABX0XAH2_9BACT|nr:hypothetical protein [Neolewinella antarctica]NJC25954.1 hypothetical protein [Neolewinella antarctica]
MDPNQSIYPWFSSNSGGGGLTSGNGQNFSIHYTDNFFSGDPSSYNNHGYGRNTYKWLFISSHEVVHIKQNIDWAISLGYYSPPMLVKNAYLGHAAGQYAIAGSHDGARNEILADIGSETFKDFDKFIDKFASNQALIKLLESQHADAFKVAQVDRWWKKYRVKVTKGRGGAIFLGNNPK